MTSENWQGINIKGGKPTIKNNTFNFESPEQNPPNNILFQGSANFVGREHELAILGERLQKSGFVAISAVSGMGGVGKTELVTQYARKHEADYPGGICWLSAREADLAAKIVQFAQLYMKLEVPQRNSQGNLLSLTEQVAWCWQNWQPQKGLVLIILDDVTQLENFPEILPKSNRFRVLITTRLRSLDPNIEELSLDVLSPEEALQLLTILVGESRIKGELEKAQELCKWLGYLPLGLELVGRYMVKKPPNLTLVQILERLKEQRLLNEAINPYEQQLQQSLSTAQRGVLAAFELSWQELEEKTQRVGELLSLFAPDIFFWKWVESISNLLNWVATDVEKANEQLDECHFVQLIEQTNCYKIHPLILEFLKVKLIASEQANNLKQAFVETFIEIAQTIPSSPTKEFIQSIKDAIPHLAETAQNLTDAISNEDLLCLFVSLGRFYEGQGLYALTETWYQQCVSVVESRLGEENVYVATSFHNLALLYNVTGRYVEAEPLYQQALALYIRLVGEEHQSVATTLNSLALLYNVTGRYVEAELLYQQALALYKRVLGEEHFLVANNLNGLAEIYRATGRYVEAEPLYQQALALYIRLVGEEHPNVATSLNNLALVYQDAGRYKQAEPLYQQALALCKRALGEEHPDVATTLNNLGSLYDATGHYEQAEPLYQQALALRRRVLGEEHPNVAISLNNLAYLYEATKRYEQAESLYQQALEIVNQRLGVSHSYTVTIRKNLESLRDKLSRR